MQIIYESNSGSKGTEKIPTYLHIPQEDLSLQCLHMVICNIFPCCGLFFLAMQMSGNAVAFINQYKGHEKMHTIIILYIASDLNLHCLPMTLLQVFR